MPVVTFSYDDLISLIGHDVPVDTLIERIPQIGADLHSYNKEDRQFIIEFFPDRPDLYCVEGAARSLRTFLGFEKGMKVYPMKKSGITLRRDPSVSSVRPYIVAGAVKK